MNRYQKAMLYLIASQPKKIPALVNLRRGFKANTKKYFLRGDGLTAPPISIAIRSSYKCNLRCIQCGQWGKRGALLKASKDEISRSLTTKEVKSFIAEVALFRPYLFFTGGEPLLRDDIVELIKYSGYFNLIRSISTNCTLLESKAEQLVKAKLDVLFASLDGTEKINDQIRLGECVHNRAIRGLRTLINARKKYKTKLPIIQAQMTLTRENQYNLLEMAEFMDKDLKVDIFGITPGVFTTEKLNKLTTEVYKKEFNIDQKYWQGFIRDVSGMDIQAIDDQIAELKSRKWQFRLRLYPPIGYSDFSFDDYFNFPNKVFGKVFCTVPHTFTQLQPNGDIAACGSQPDYIAGNIFKSKFLDIWNGEPYRKFRKYLNTKLFPSCPRCWALYQMFDYSS